MNTVIIGCGGHGKVVLDILQKIADIDVVGFIDDDPKVQHVTIHGIPVLGTTDALPVLIRKHGIEFAIIAIGNRKIRAKLFQKVNEAGLKLINAVHPGAIVAKDVKMGKGVMVAAGAIINTDTIIGDDVIINTGATVDHDNKIGDHVNIQPGVSLGGSVTVKAFGEVGIGATVIQNVSIGEGSVVGAGAVIITGVPDNVTVVGVPGKIIKVNTP